jgi:hypothetical protein
MNRVPDTVARVAAVMSAFPITWFLCGGWAVDAWLGHEAREHGDIDVAIFQDEQQAVFDRLAGWNLIGHDDSVDPDTEEPWTGRHIDVPGHIHARTHGLNLEFVLNHRAGPDWVLIEDPRITLPLGKSARTSAWGLPTALPEVVLLYKARDDIRPRDEVDFAALLPLLTRQQASWLRDAIALVRPGHPWLPQLSV